MDKITNRFDTQSFIAIFLVISMVALVFTIAFMGKAPNDDTFKVLSGALATVGFATIVSFYFGSSSGSKSKDDAMSGAMTALSQKEPELSKTPLTPTLTPEKGTEKNG